jgi:hypothetical protein
VYFTKINHDFNFDLSVQMDKVFYHLTFQRVRISKFFSLLKYKTIFHTNQGRQTYLLQYIPFNKRKRRYIFIVKGVISFYWEEETKKIYYKHKTGIEDTLIKYWLLHTFLPLYFVLENIYEILHVGAVEVAGKALLFAAPSFGGKSTLTHYFLKQGHALLSDDRLGLVKQNNSYIAIPSYPYARNYRALENLGEYVDNFAKRPLEVNCIYHLKQVGAGKSVSIRELKGIEKFSVIEMSKDIKLSSFLLEKFPILHDLVQNLTIYELQVPQDIDRLNEVYTVIVKQQIQDKYRAAYV